MSATSPRPPLEVAITRVGDECVVSLIGEVDVGTADLVESGIKQASLSDSTTVVVDLSELEFIDSTGLKVLVAADSSSRQDGGRIRFRGPVGEQVESVLRLTQLDRRFKLG